MTILALFVLLTTSTGCAITDREIIFADITEQSDLLDGIPRLAQNEVLVSVEKADGKTEVVTIKNAGQYRIITGNNYAELLRIYKMYITGELVPSSK